MAGKLANSKEFPRNIVIKTSIIFTIFHIINN